MVKRRNKQLVGSYRFPNDRSRSVQQSNEIIHTVNDTKPHQNNTLDEVKDFSHVKPLIFKVSLKNKMSDYVEIGYITKHDKSHLVCYTNNGKVVFRTIDGSYIKGPRYSLSKSSFSAVRGFNGNFAFDNKFNGYFHQLPKGFNVIDCTMGSELAEKYKSYYPRFTEMPFMVISVDNSINTI